eukprot:NODE_582_length_1462_cov_269.300640.p1 GENE.NODE_582_length_1462_cov_269.300640~~NODE_582_length_1462_cov_269.300640.p1  ORF type:complete len:382 (+),score=160.09 NODE_582_length_1462_cov_269.300640:52-1197(+)
MAAALEEAARPAKAARVGARAATLEEVRRLPKVELHAHLSGSISQAKLSELLAEQGGGETFAPFDPRKETSNAVENCYCYFSKVAQVITGLDALRRTALIVLDAFAESRCLYLELRTSPKEFKLPASGNGAPAHTSKLQYLEAIEAAIGDFRSHAAERFGHAMEVKLLLSVVRDRLSSLEQALKQVDDILELARASPGLVVGVDVCGDPSAKTVVPYVIPALMQRREALAAAGLPITFHTADLADDVESRCVLDHMAALNIRRLGHVCFLPEDCRRRILEGEVGVVGIELCPTSNLVSRQLKDLKEHHLLDWWRRSDNALVSINTDDMGLFCCDLNSELYDIAQAFDLTLSDLAEMQRQALRSCFHPEKERLLKLLEAAAA